MSFDVDLFYLLKNIINEYLLFHSELFPGEMKHTQNTRAEIDLFCLI